MINIDERYSIGVDSLNYTLLRRRVRKSGKNEGKEYYEPVGYFHSVLETLKAYHREIVRDGFLNGDMALSDAVKTIREADEKVLGMIESVFKEPEIRKKEGD